MKQAAKALDFIAAAQLRDEIKVLKENLQLEKSNVIANYMIWFCGGF